MGILDDMKNMLAIGNCKYCGGHPSITKICDGQLVVTKEKISFTSGIFKSLNIPISNITDSSIKSEEHISKDVTLTRLLLVGVFAFGLKKKRTDITSYLVIQFNEGGVPINVIFTGKDIANLNAGIIKARQQYNAATTEYAPATVAAGPISVNKQDDIYAQIEKLNDLKTKGILSEEEFQTKKQDLLARI